MPGPPPTAARPSLNTIPRALSTRIPPASNVPRPVRKNQRPQQRPVKAAGRPGPLKNGATNNTTTSPNNNNNNSKVKKKTSLTSAETSKILQQAEEYIRAKVTLIAACQDEEITIDCSNVLVRFGLRQSKMAVMAVGNDGGACTSVLLKILYKYASNPEDNGVPSYAKLLAQMRNMLKAKGYPQVPALTSSRYLTMKDEFRVIPSNFNGTRRALIIGINYTGEEFEIPGCHNDCWNMIKFLKDVHGFVDDDFTILMDDAEKKYTQPTRDNICKTLHRFAWSVKPGDAVFFHYAGHGSTQADLNGDEESGMDSTMLPVDYQTKGVIVDDEIFRMLLVPLPKGSAMTAIMDCCHSGTIFDLPFEYIGDSKTIGGQTQEEVLLNVNFPHMDLVKAEQQRIECMAALQKRASQIELEFLKPPKPQSNVKNKNNNNNNRRKGVSPPPTGRTKGRTPRKSHSSGDDSSSSSPRKPKSRRPPGKSKSGASPTRPRKPPSSTPQPRKAQSCGGPAPSSTTQTPPRKSPSSSGGASTPPPPPRKTYSGASKSTDDSSSVASSSPQPPPPQQKPKSRKPRISTNTTMSTNDSSNHSDNLNPSKPKSNYQGQPPPQSSSSRPPINTNNTTNNNTTTTKPEAAAVSPTVETASNKNTINNNKNDFEDKKEEAQNCLMGAMLLCLNPCKLFRVMH